MIATVRPCLVTSIVVPLAASSTYSSRFSRKSSNATCLAIRLLSLGCTSLSNGLPAPSMPSHVPNGRHGRCEADAGSEGGRPAAEAFHRLEPLGHLGRPGLE